MQRFLQLVLIVTLVTFAGCIVEVNQSLLEITGTVRFVELEGGFFGVVADDGTQYEPINLPKEYYQDGLRVHLWAKIREDYASIFMWGTIIEIGKIEVLS
ncbi:MAG: hypothetical protein ABDK94_05755 [Atribacterota bacterium]